MRKKFVIGSIFSVVLLLGCVIMWAMAPDPHMSKQFYEHSFWEQLKRGGGEKLWKISGIIFLSAWLGCVIGAFVSKAEDSSSS